MTAIHVGDTQTKRTACGLKIGARYWTDAPGKPLRFGVSGDYIRTNLRHGPCEVCWQVAAVSTPEGEGGA